MATHAQAPRELPFAVGERLSYEARAGHIFGGRAELSVDGPVEVRGTATLVLRFTFDTKVGPFRVSDRTASWFDPVRMASVRFEKRERRPLHRHDEDVDIDGPRRKWQAADGRAGDSPSDAPLDELSFIYTIRALRIPDDSTLILERHFDAERNPTKVRLISRDTLTTPAGRFAADQVEMRVRDARHYHGEGVIRLWLSDDACRRPVQIESDIPGAGHIVLALVEASPAVPACGALSALGERPDGVVGRNP